MKRFLIISAVIVLLLVAAGFGVRSYLRSHRVAQQVTARLQTMVGGSVRVENVDIGLGSTAISGLALYEEGKDGDPDGRWLKVAALTVDVSLWDLLSGNAMPKKVTLRGATLVLRFDRQGNLLTRFAEQSALEGAESTKPETLPAGMLEQGEIIFRKEGQPDLVAKNVNAQVRHENGQLVLSGTADNAELGKLILNGTLDKDGEKAAFQLKNAAKAHVTQSVLDRFPFVPAETWHEIQIAEADTTAELNLRYDLKAKNLQYRVELAPENTKLVIPAISLSVQGAHGKVTIEDNVVQLRAIEGQAFGGVLRTEADLDFRGQPTKFAFTKIQVQDVNVSELPDSWHIPPQIRKIAPKGKMTGSASLELTLTPKRMTAGNVGEWVSLLGAAHATGHWLAPTCLLALFHGDEVRTQGSGKAKVTQSAIGAEPLEFDWHVGPHQTPMSRLDNPAEVHVAALLTREIIVGLGDGKNKTYRDAECRAALWHDAPLREGVHLFLTLALFQEGLKKQPDQGADYVDINLNLKDVSLAELVKNLDIKAPFSLEGKASLHVKASMPTDQSKKFKAQGSMRLTDLVVAGLKLGDVDAELVYADGVLDLTSLKSNLGDQAEPGTVRGSGRLEMDPPGELRADLTFERVPIARLAALEKGRLQGTFSGKINVRGPADKLGIDTLKADGNITSDRLVIDGLSLEQISSSIKLDKGVLRLPDLQLRSGGTPIAAAGELNMKDYSFRANLDLRKWNLAALPKWAGADKNVAFSVAGAFTTSAVVEGKLEPFQVTASGDARAENVKVNAFEAQLVNFHWETDGKKLEIKDVKAELYGGKATGSGVVPMDSAQPGKMNLRVEGLETKQLAKDLHVPFRIEGKADGTLQGSLPPLKEGESRKATLKLDVKAPKLRVQNIPTEQLHGTLDYDKGVFGYKLEGKSLGGTFDLEGQIPAAAEPAKEKTKKGRLSIQGVGLHRLFEALGLPAADGLFGRFNLSMDYSHKDGDIVPHDGEGTIRLSGIRWKDRIIAESLQGDIMLSDQQLRVRHVQGTLAEGTLSAQLFYHFRQPSRSWFKVSLDNVETAALLAPWLEGKIEGSLQARIRGNLADGWRGSADFDLAHGKVFGLGVTQWHLPATWSYCVAQNRGQIDIYETTAQVAHGRATGKMSLSSDGGAARLEGSVRFANADMKELLRQTIGPSQLGGGIATGRIEFAGANVRSVNDIGTKVAVSFNQTQALRMPILNQISPFVGVGASTTFQKGDMVARLDRGVLRIQQLTLQGNKVQLYVDGTVALEGRLDLGVIAKTGDVGLPTNRLRLLGLAIPVAGPVPLAVIIEVSNLLSNRVIYLQVTGTPHSPVIRVQPVALLRDTAVRFFLDRANIPILD